MTTIEAAGFEPGSAYTPSLHVSPGDADGTVNLLFREQDGENTRVLTAPFDAGALIAAIRKSVEISRLTKEVA